MFREAMSKVYKFICVECKGEFEGHWKKRYCEPCKDIVFGRNCKQCGIRFIDQKHPDNDFCSHSCHGTWRKEEAEKQNPTTYIPCPQCGVLFGIREGNKRKKKFCSSICANRFYNKSDPTKRELINCQWCNKEFESWTYRNSKFCSHQCVSEYGAWVSSNKEDKHLYFGNGEKEVSKCVMCDAEILYTPLSAGHKRKYCQECDGRTFYTAYGHVRGENHAWFYGGVEQEYGKNWKKQRIKALKRDKYTCQECGYIKGQGTMQLHVHHIIPRKVFLEVSIEHLEKEGNKLENLITLCNSCHRTVEVELRKHFIR